MVQYRRHFIFILFIMYYTNTTPIFIRLSAVDGYNLVPNIRPLETLHNSLSLNQITEFFDKIIKVFFFTFKFFSIFLNFGIFLFFILDGRSWKST